MAIYKVAGDGDASSSKPIITSYALQSSKPTMPTHGERNLELGNQAYAASFDQGHLALPPSQRYTIGKHLQPHFQPSAANMTRQ